MARTLNVDEINFYRALVTREWSDREDSQSVYGPYSLPGNCRDYDDRFYRSLGVVNTKVEVQRLEALAILEDADHGEYEPFLAWVTIRTRVSDGWTE